VSVIATEKKSLRQSESSVQEKKRQEERATKTRGRIASGSWSWLLIKFFATPELIQKIHDDDGKKTKLCCIEIPILIEAKRQHLGRKARRIFRGGRKK